jgi:hypothetical protein
MNEKKTTPTIPEAISFAISPFQFSGKETLLS